MRCSISLRRLLLSLFVCVCLSLSHILSNCVCVCVSICISLCDFVLPQEGTSTCQMSLRGMVNRKSLGELSVRLPSQMVRAKHS
jgi:hypothetical protein